MPRNTIDWESRIGRRLGVRDLHVFFTVVQRGSMAKAAQQLNVTQPAVSKAIGDLEHALGVRLLDRRPQGVEPTMYGQALLKRGTVVFDELKQTIRDIEFLADPTVGEVRFGCHESVAAALLPPIMERFSRQYPRVALRMEQIGVVGIALELPSLHQRLIDFAMVRLSKPLADQQVADELHLEILFNDPLVVVAARHSRWARRRKIDLAELIAEPWILPGRDTPNYIGTEPRGGALPRVCPRGCQVVRHPANCTQNTQIVSDVVRTQALKTVPPSRARQAGFFGTVTTTPIDGPRIPGPQDQRRLSPSMSPY